jgi:hypothetical protein
MKNKTPKPRVMWANYYPKFVGAPSIYPDRERAEQAAAGCTKPVRVAVIPLDDVEAIVKRAVAAYFTDKGFTYGDGIRAALTAAGIPCTKRKARK